MKTTKEETLDFDTIEQTTLKMNALMQDEEIDDPSQNTLIKSIGIDQVSPPAKAE